MMRVPCQLARKKRSRQFGRKRCSRQLGRKDAAPTRRNRCAVDGPSAAARNERDFHSHTSADGRRLMRRPSCVVWVATAAATGEVEAPILRVLCVYFCAPSLLAHLAPAPPS